MPHELYHACDPEQFSFETTNDIKNLVEFIGQPRAVDALQFGMEIEREGYNIFALGEYGIGKHNLVHRFLEDKATQKNTPPDTCYVNNFQTPHKPRILHVPPGRGKELASDMERIIEDIRNALRAAFESEEYESRERMIREQVGEKQHSAFEELQQKAKEKDLSVLRTPMGLIFAPVKEGQVVSSDDFLKWPEEQQKRVKQDAEELQQDAQKFFHRIPAWEREIRDQIDKLDREIVGYAIEPLLNGLREKYRGIEQIIDYIGAVEKDIVDNSGLFRTEGTPAVPGETPVFPGPSAPPGAKTDTSAFRRYSVNVLVDNAETKGAPVVYEDNPTYQNLFGRLEYMPILGALLTDFNMIRAGALHRANGGYLIVDALKILLSPFAWDGLKRMLKSHEIKIEPLDRAYGFVSTFSLDPEPAKLDIKVVLIGPPLLYYLLREYDPEFGQMFKVKADFAAEMNRTPDNVDEYSRLIGTFIQKEMLLPFDRSAVARVIEHGSREVEDTRKLSLFLQRETDLLREADYWARKNGSSMVRAADVQQAIDAGIYRSDRVRDRTQELIQRDIVLIDTEGARAGQANGLSVIQLGEFAFGRPSRITARIRLGKGEVIDIEREVNMSGPIHSKGVLILAGFLGARYAADRPLSLSASLVFEQSYSGVEGDSASSAELYTLLSAIAEVPIKQSLAITGSVNQHGRIQPIGGVNEKIEGFFDTCNARGLTGGQGVLIPASNVQHLMLREDVIQAVKNGKFHIYSIEVIDDGMELLTGLPAGVPDEKGNYPEESLNGKVYARLTELAKKRSEFGQAAGRGES